MLILSGLLLGSATVATIGTIVAHKFKKDRDRLQQMYDGQNAIVKHRQGWNISIGHYHQVSMDGGQNWYDCELAVGRGSGLPEGEVPHPLYPGCMLHQIKIVGPARDHRLTLEIRIA